MRDNHSNRRVKHNVYRNMVCATAVTEDISKRLHVTRSIATLLDMTGYTCHTFLLILIAPLTH